MDLYIGAVNCSIHVIMYSYYLMSSFPRLRNITNCIKSFITIAQIMQFITVLSNFYIAFSMNCYLSITFYLQAIQVVVLLVLFIKFYAQSYAKKGQRRKID